MSSLLTKMEQDKMRTAFLHNHRILIQVHYHTVGWYWPPSVDHYFRPSVFGIQKEWHVTLILRAPRVWQFPRCPLEVRCTPPTPHIPNPISMTIIGKWLHQLWKYLLLPGCKTHLTKTIFYRKMPQARILPNSQKQLPLLILSVFHLTPGIFPANHSFLC